MRDFGRMGLASGIGQTGVNGFPLQFTIVEDRHTFFTSPDG